MRQARYLASAERNFIEIYRYVATESRDPDTALATTGAIRRQCTKLAGLPGTLGRARSELGDDIRSFPFRSYVIYFRYCPDAVEIVAVLHGHRDVIAYFGDDAAS